jgi:hypothetical protein
LAFRIRGCSSVPLGSDASTPSTLCQTKPDCDPHKEKRVKKCQGKRVKNVKEKCTEKMYFATWKKVLNCLYCSRKRVSFNPKFVLQVFESGIFVFKLLNGRIEAPGIKTHNFLKNIFMATRVITENMLFLGFNVHI